MKWIMLGVIRCRQERKLEKLRNTIGKHLDVLIPCLKQYYGEDWIYEIEQFAKNLREERIDEDFDFLFERMNLNELCKSKKRR